MFARRARVPTPVKLAVAARHLAAADGRCRRSPRRRPRRLTARGDDRLPAGPARRASARRRSPTSSSPGWRRRRRWPPAGRWGGPGPRLGAGVGRASATAAVERVGTSTGRAVRALPLHGPAAAGGRRGAGRSCRWRGGRWRCRRGRSPTPRSAAARRRAGASSLGAVALDGVGPVPRPADDGRGLLAVDRAAGATAASRCPTTPAGCVTGAGRDGACSSGCCRRRSPTRRSSPSTPAMGVMETVGLRRLLRRPPRRRRRRRGDAAARRGRGRRVARSRRG